MAKGYKTCKCGAEVKGVRTLICPVCESSFFTERTHKTVYSLPGGYDLPDGPIERIDTPAGSPPLMMNYDDFPADDDILEWAANVRQDMLNKGVYVTNNGLAYWARKVINNDFKFPPLGNEMRHVGTIIKGMPDVTYKEIEI